MTPFLRNYFILTTAIYFLLASTLLCAHSEYPAYLKIQQSDQSFLTEWSIPVHELEKIINLDTNADGDIVWSEIESNEAALKQTLLATMSLPGRTSQNDFQDVEVLYDTIRSEPYLVLRFSSPKARGPEPSTLDYSAFELFGRGHRCFVTVTGPNGSNESVLSPHNPFIELGLTRPQQLTASIQIIGEGVWHILIGYDHILFLLALIIPVVLGQKNASSDLNTVMKRSIGIVTAFTVAHSVTLAISVLGLYQPPEKLTELIIAFSVGLAAMANLSEKGRQHGPRIALIFGLIHGFGFANVMSGLDLTSGSLFMTLALFNLGVEFGQLLILTAIVPLTFTMRNTPLYRVGVVGGGSLAILGVSAFWFFTRL